MVLDGYTYVFAIGTCFALLEAFNNGASTSPLLSPLQREAPRPGIGWTVDTPC
jgi:hypothetical protein